MLKGLAFNKQQNKNKWKQQKWTQQQSWSQQELLQIRVNTCGGKFEVLNFGGTQWIGGHHFSLVLPILKLFYFRENLEICNFRHNSSSDNLMCEIVVWNCCHSCPITLWKLDRSSEEVGMQFPCPWRPLGIKYLACPWERIIAVSARLAWCYTPGRIWLAED